MKLWFTYGFLVISKGIEINLLNPFMTEAVII